MNETIFIIYYFPIFAVLFCLLVMFYYSFKTRQLLNSKILNYFLAAISVSFVIRVFSAFDYDGNYYAWTRRLFVIPYIFWAIGFRKLYKVIRTMLKNGNLKHE